MEQEQLKQLYVSFAVGFFANNYLPPKDSDLAVHDMKLKRLFRTYCKHAYEFDPITAEYMNPDLWQDWTWIALQTDLR